MFGGVFNVWYGFLFLVVNPLNDRTRRFSKMKKFWNFAGTKFAHSCVF